MKKTLLAIALFTFASFAHAQPIPGEVRKIDKETSRVTLKHAEIKKHDMPAMTMVFRVKEPTMLDTLKEGMTILFETEKIGGYWTIISFQPVP
jgi:Cu(I)/Ag(I) efflux system periplasmic protein CusF